MTDSAFVDTVMATAARIQQIINRHKEEQRTLTEAEIEISQLSKELYDAAMERLRAQGT